MSGNYLIHLKINIFFRIGYFCVIQYEFLMDLFKYYKLKSSEKAFFFFSFILPYHLKISHHNLPKLYLQSPFKFTMLLCRRKKFMQPKKKPNFLLPTVPLYTLLIIQRSLFSEKPISVRLYSLSVCTFSTLDFPT